MGGMHISGELSVEARCCLAQRPGRIQRGEENLDGHTERQYGPTASGACTRAPLPGVLRHRQGVQLA